jgi:hypothetical protein
MKMSLAELKAKTGDSHNFKMIRRSCKYGFEHVLNCIRDGLMPNAKIHFILDGMQMPEVLAKKRMGQDNRVPITTSELRYCFRKWRSLRTVVCFYEHYRVTHAPWEANPMPWQEYAAERAVKLYQALMGKKNSPTVWLTAGVPLEVAKASLDQLRDAGNYMKDEIAKKNAPAAAAADE